MPSQYVPNVGMEYLIVQGQRRRSRYAEYDIDIVRAQDIQNYLRSSNGNNLLK